MRQLKITRAAGSAQLKYVQRLIRPHIGKHEEILEGLVIRNRWDAQIRQLLAIDFSFAQHQLDNVRRFVGIGLSQRFAKAAVLPQWLRRAATKKPVQGGRNEVSELHVG
jgi:hypothetical protein